MKALTHINNNGDPHMVDISHKNATDREAVATRKVHFPEEVFKLLQSQDFNVAKGNIIQTAIIAGIMAVKKTSEFIPLCHPLALSKVDIDIQPKNSFFLIESRVKCHQPTGVEMEALTGVSVSALTLYDMCKALSHDIRITDIQLDKKSGGKNDFER